MADDSEHDAFFVKRALEKSGVRHFLHAVINGEGAVSYLRGEGQFSDRQQFPFPNVLLCDLKMPNMDGFGVLRWLQGHPECRVIPTIIYSSSAAETDVHESYVLGANAYMQKPSSAEELAQHLRYLYDFWSSCHVPPPPPNERCS